MDPENILSINWIGEYFWIKSYAICRCLFLQRHKKQPDCINIKPFFKSNVLQ